MPTRSTSTLDTWACQSRRPDMAVMRRGVGLDSAAEGTYLRRAAAT